MNNCINACFNWRLYARFDEKWASVIMDLWSLFINNNTYLLKLCEFIIFAKNACFSRRYCVPLVEKRANIMEKSNYCKIFNFFNGNLSAKILSIFIDLRYKSSTFSNRYFFMLFFIFIWYSQNQLASNLNVLVQNIPKLH